MRTKPKRRVFGAQPYHDVFVSVNELPRLTWMRDQSRGGMGKVLYETEVSGNISRDFHPSHDQVDHFLPNSFLHHEVSSGRVTARVVLSLMQGSDALEAANDCVYVSTLSCPPKLRPPWN